jgi:hypothetical protein
MMLEQEYELGAASTRVDALPAVLHTYFAVQAVRVLADEGSGHERSKALAVHRLGACQRHGADSATMEATLCM